MRDAHIAGDVTAHVLDLAMYEVGNVLVRALRWAARDIVDQLDDLRGICGTPLVATGELFRDAAELAAAHGLSFYDVAWAAAARGPTIPLVSADHRIVDAGLAESPTIITQRLRLRIL